jgi:hypothetical protein
MKQRTIILLLSIIGVLSVGFVVFQRHQHNQTELAFCEEVAKYRGSWLHLYDPGTNELMKWKNLESDHLNIIVMRSVNLKPELRKAVDKWVDAEREYIRLSIRSIEDSQSTSKGRCPEFS